MTASLWTAIVPAAGRGSRLGYDQPKILYPVAGRTVLEHLTAALDPLCERMVFVVSPSGQTAIERALETHLPGKWETAIQPEPIGMADAVARGVELVNTPHTIVVWGDQAGLRAEAAALCAHVHETAGKAATIPTVLRADPYVHFERNAAGRLTRILQAREGDPMPAQGESDTGLFCFKTEALRHALEALEDGWAIGARTGERNFLPAFAWMDRELGGVLCPGGIMHTGDTIGLNSSADLLLLERWLADAQPERVKATP